MPSLITSDNGVSSGSAGLKTTASNDGILALQTTTAGGTATTAVTIDTSQNVGVGTASPTTKLDVSGDANTVLRINGSNTSGLTFAEGGVNKQQIYMDEANLIFYSIASTTERMRLDASGNFGIGNTSPNRKLYVQSDDSSTGGNVVGVRNSNTTAGAFINFIAGGSNAPSIGAKNNDIVFTADGYSGAERARITSGGVLLVGTTTANGGLSGAGAINTIAGFGINRNLTDNSGRRNWAISTESLNIGDFTINSSTTNTGDPTTVRLQIRNDGSCYNGNGTWGSLSDAKIKENVIDATPKLDNLMQVRVVNYNRIGETRKEIGVIAQELEQIFPGMVDESEDLVDGQPTGTTTKAVKYSVFVPMLIKAIQELNAKVDAQAAEIAALKGN